MSDIRELVETFDKAAQDWGWERDWGYGNSVPESERSHAAAKAALLAAIARLEAKAATAKAECKAWREYDSALRRGESNLNRHHDAMDTARAATDEAWREQAREPKQ